MFSSGSSRSHASASATSSSTPTFAASSSTATTGSTAIEDIPGQETVTYGKPSDIDPKITQPVELVVQFMWIIGKAGGNSNFCCKLCATRFWEQPTKAMSHFDSSLSNSKQRVRSCTATFPLLLREQIRVALECKKKENEKNEKKRNYSAAMQPQIRDSLFAMTKPSADAAILQFIVRCGIPPSIIEEPLFRNLIVALRDAETNYIPPKRHAFGLNASQIMNEETQLANPDKLGAVLFAEITKIREVKKSLLSGLSYVGGTLRNDGVKWGKRNLINSVLITATGSFFAQSTDATGHHKDAKYLLQDVISAINAVGQENVFIVALDGACKATTKMIWDMPSLHMIFPQRCTTHGCNLLIADIGKLFTWEITMCMRLVKFVCNHGTIFDIFKKISNTLQLLGTCETRFASQIYSSERILADEEPLRELFFLRL